MTPSAPLFSVIVPWHGNREHLARALASLRRQTFRNFEIVVVCNGAGAANASELAADPAYADCRFEISPAADANRARNLGIDTSQGRWLAFLDVDDRFLPAKLARMATAIERDDADVLLSRGVRVRSQTVKGVYPVEILRDGEDVGEFFFSRGANCSVSAIVVRRDLARGVRFVDGHMPFDDPDFLVRAQAQGARIRMLAEPLYEWWDNSEAGRVSREANYPAQAQWAANLRPALSDKAYYAFLARRIAQHQFPGNFTETSAALYRGWRLGGIPPWVVAQFIVRGLLPRSVVRRVIDYRTRREDRQVSRRPEMAGGHEASDP